VNDRLDRHHIEFGPTRSKSGVVYGMLTEHVVDDRVAELLKDDAATAAERLLNPLDGACRIVSDLPRCCGTRHKA